MAESNMADRTHNITPRPGPHQRQRQRQSSPGGSSSQILFASPVLAGGVGRTTRSSMSQAGGTVQQPTPIRKTPRKPLLDPASPFVDEVTAVNAYRNEAVTMMTPVKQADPLLNFSIITPMHFSAHGMERNLNDPDMGLGLGMGMGMGMGMTGGMGLGMGMNDSSSIVYIDGVAVATPERGTTGMVYPGAWMGSGGVGMEMHLPSAARSGAGPAGGQNPGRIYASYGHEGQAGAEAVDGGPMMGYHQGSVGPEFRRYPTTLGAGRPTTMPMDGNSATPTHARVASTSISGWQGDSRSGSPTLGAGFNPAVAAPGFSRSVSAVPPLVASSRLRGAATRGVKRLRQVTHDGTTGMPSSSYSHHAPSRSVSSVASSMTSDSSASSTFGHPLTFRPLARMPARTISTASSASASTSSWDHPGSPMMPPASAYPIPHGGHFEHPMAYHHRRNYSNMSGMTNFSVGTPALEYGMDSPALGYVPVQMLTPTIGQDGGFYYNQMPAYGQVSVHQQLGGLAIQGEDMNQPQYLGMLQEEGLNAEPPLESQYLNQDPVQYQEFNAGPSSEQQCMPPDSSHPRQMTEGVYVGSSTSVHVPVDVNLYTAPIPRNSTPVMWSAGETESHGMPAYPSVLMADTSVVGPRHVSTPIIPDEPYGSWMAPPVFALPRSVSDGYQPMFSSSQPSMPTYYAPASSAMQQSASFEGPSSSAPYLQLTPGAESDHGPLRRNIKSEDGTASPMTEGGERSAKRNKIKHPTVGKRLRPGPKPKPKTPKKGITSGGQASRGNETSSDPFLEDHPLPQVPDASQELAATDPDPMTVDNSMPPAPVALTAAEAISTIPRSYLESCYASYFFRDMENGGAAVKRYRCNIDDCTREFPRKSAIHSHIQTHLEDKPFVCPDPECNAAFVRQHDLRRHVRIHSGTKPFPCPCGKGFARGDALMRHRQRGICDGSLVPMRKSPRKQESSDERGDSPLAPHGPGPQA